jgi:hypothetical protein
METHTVLYRFIVALRALGTSDNPPAPEYGEETLHHCNIDAVEPRGRRAPRADADWQRYNLVIA